MMIFAFDEMAMIIATSEQTASHGTLIAAQFADNTCRSTIIRHLELRAAVKSADSPESTSSLYRRASFNEY